MSADSTNTKPAATPEVKRPERMPGRRDHQNFRRQGKNPHGRHERKDEFEKRIVKIRRVTRVYSGGKRMRISVCVVIGDRKGKVGIALGKGADVITAEEKAVSKAKKTMKTIQLRGKTIAHEVLFKRGATRIMLKPASPGTGVIAGAPLRAVLELAGIEDILTKSLGSTNPINNAYACVDALLSLKPFKEQIKNDK
jgi:small subunit ribosomal protein S5